MAAWYEYQQQQQQIWQQAAAEGWAGQPGDQAWGNGYAAGHQWQNCAAGPPNGPGQAAWEPDSPSGMPSDADSHDALQNESYGHEVRDGEQVALPMREAHGDLGAQVLRRSETPEGTLLQRRLSLEAGPAEGGRTGPDAHSTGRGRLSQRRSTGGTGVDTLVTSRSDLGTEPGSTRSEPPGARLQASNSADLSLSGAESWWEREDSSLGGEAPAT